MPSNLQNSPSKLQQILDRLDIPYKARFSIDEVADILGIQRKQVTLLLHRQKLRGMRSSPRRWSWVFADDLEEYIETINRTSSCNQKCDRFNTGMDFPKNFYETIDGQNPDDVLFGL